MSATRRAGWAWCVAVASALLLTLGACTTGGTPDEASAPPKATAEVSDQTTKADAAWIAGMAAHHDQAVALAELAETRAADSEVLAAAERIATGQAAEAAALRTWLDHRGLTDTAHHDESGMPGEISATAFAQAEAASGAAFDRVFVDTMIRHHEGAVAMCEERLEASGDPAVTRWARTVSTGQAVELDRLAELRAQLTEGEAPD